MEAKCDGFFRVWAKWQSEVGDEPKRPSSQVRLAIEHIAACSNCLHRASQSTAGLTPEYGQMATRASVSPRGDVERSHKEEIAQRERNIIDFIRIERASGLEDAFLQLPSVAAELAMNADTFERYYLYKELLSEAPERKGVKDRIRSLATKPRSLPSSIRQLVRVPEAMETRVKDTGLRIQRDIATAYKLLVESFAQVQPAAETATRSLEDQLYRLGMAALTSTLATESGRKCVSSAWISVVVPLAAEVLTDVGEDYEEQLFANRLREMLGQSSTRHSLEAALAKEGAPDPAVFARLLAELAVRYPHIVKKHVAEMALQGWIELSDNLRVALEISDKNSEGGESGIL